MTYCVGLLVREGIVMLSDTRTSAGVDNISTYRKMFTYEVPGERAIAICTSGSLSVTQTTIARIEEAIADEDSPSILNAATMLQVVERIGNELSTAVREVAVRLGGEAGKSGRASLLVAGQRAEGAMRLFLVYPEGNFIEATDDTPYLQIGEHKYGKPILDRVVRPETTLVDAQKAALLSMDSTMRSNLGVGMPLDLCVIEADRCAVAHRRRIEPDDATFGAMSVAWSRALSGAFEHIEI